MQEAEEWWWRGREGKRERERQRNASGREEWERDGEEGKEEVCSS